MSDLPAKLTSSGLWVRLQRDVTLQQTIVRLRDVVEALASKISEQIPEFTDHSVKHLDALWWVADQVLTKDEMNQITPGEAFVLGGALYLHDLGMAKAATGAGAAELAATPQYSAAFRRLKTLGVAESPARVLALRSSARELHARLAADLAVARVAGLDRYLIEDTDIRGNWGSMIGQVAASHHWSLPEVDRILGIKGRFPDSRGEAIDLGYLACLLRVIDFAHINMDRASTLERLLRPNLPPASLVHWDAQEHITGPWRDGNQLVYGSTKGIESIDGWWMFFEMASGLDAEITNVHDYLLGRTFSVSRFSLEGVKGVRSPQTFAAQVTPSGFDPVDIRFRPDSMERLIQILGGRTLYGNDRFAPIRELLQNAADAVKIAMIEQSEAGGDGEPGLIRIKLQETKGNWELSVEDNGVGMSAQVLTNYLLGIAADYWRSPDYFSDHPAAARSGFRPIGRFGIGFLSIFMLGDEVEVRTQRRGGQRLKLRLKGIGRRGSLEKLPSTYLNGTTVRVLVSRDTAADLLDILPEIVCAKAPMLTIPIEITTPRGTSSIAPGWWKTVSQEDLSAFIHEQPTASTTPTRLRRKGHPDFEEQYNPVLAKLPRLAKWPHAQPELITDARRLIAVPHARNLLLCSKGFAVAHMQSSGFTGLADIGDQELNAARSEPLSWDVDAHRETWKQELSPLVLKGLNDLSAEGDIPARYGFLVGVGREYGIELLIQTTLPWLTIREAPGNSILVTAAEFQRRAASAEEITVVYNGNPWTAERDSRRMFPNCASQIIVTSVSAEGQPDPPRDFKSRDKILDGSLEEHFVDKEFETNSGDPMAAVLLQATLLCLARAWHTEPSRLICTWKKLSDVIVGRFLKTENPPTASS